MDGSKSFFFWVIVSLFFGGSLQAASPSTDKYVDIRAQLKAIATQYPEVAHIVTLGVSDSGQPIEGIRIGSGPTHHLVVATHHGNEYGSTEVARGLARSLAESPIKDVSTTVIPVLNISGYDRKIRYESAKGSSFDPNRDYEGPCGGEGPFNLKSTKLLADYVARENVVASATLHSWFPAVVYPWGLGGDPLNTLYDGLFLRLAQDAVVESKYTVGNSTEVIYAANGTYEDYAFWKHGIWSLLFEVGTTHTPSAVQVAETVRVNVPGLRRMLESAPHERAEKHAFTGKCLDKSKFYDPHDE